MLTQTELRPELEALPARLRTLRVFRGYPVPWFVADVNGEPEFRAMDGDKLRQAIAERRCWVCGDTLGRFMTFTIGPMCGVNRVSAEPSGHLECAQWSARNCPFLSRPHAKRRENDMPEESQDAPGFAIKRNPGVTLLWTTRGYQLMREGNGVLFRIGPCEAVEWYAEGKHASRAQVEESVRTGLPALQELAEAESPEAVAELARMVEVAKLLWPRE